MKDFPEFCLNLLWRPDRKLRANSEFRRAKLEVKLLSSPDAMDSVHRRGWKSTGLRACTLAHRLGWRAAWQARADAAIIFEDDVILGDDFRERLIGLALPDDWKICYFGCVFHHMPTVLGDGMVRLNGTSWDAHGYVIRKPFAKFIDREFAKVSRAIFHRPTDRELANDTIIADYHGQFPAHGVWPPMAWQAEGLSKNENNFRGNYHPDGRQILYPHLVAEMDAAHGIETPERIPRPAKPEVSAMVGGWPAPAVLRQKRMEEAGAPRPPKVTSQVWPSERRR